MHVIERDGLLEHATRVGSFLADSIMDLQHPIIESVRGRGLLRGIVLAQDVAPKVADAALDAGYLVNAPRPSVVRIAPPLIITENDVAGFVEALPSILDAAGTGGHHG